MKTNLKSFPKEESDSMEEAVYTAPFHVWKEAFEKELREQYDAFVRDKADKEHISGLTEYGRGMFETLKEILGEACGTVNKNKEVSLRKNPQ